MFTLVFSLFVCRTASAHYQNTGDIVYFVVLHILKAGCFFSYKQVYFYSEVTRLNFKIFKIYYENNASGHQQNRKHCVTFLIGWGGVGWVGVSSKGSI